jgi:flagellar M-ring protein FliF
VNYRRALEGELARTISTIGEVASARVHIAMARPSLFASQDQAATASVVLKLKGNKPLSSSTTAAISGLVAAGVEGLRPEAVVIIDNYGRPLTHSGDGRDDATGALAVERQQRVERDLSTRVVALLEPIVGPSHVRVNVSAKLNTNSEEQTVESYDPNGVVRSHQSTMQNGAGASGAQGVAGVRSNMPPPVAADGKPAAPTVAAAATPAAPGQASHMSEVTNYEVGKTVTHRIQPQGQVARLSVAVLLDDDRSGADGKGKPRAAKELEKIHEIVAAAVGFDEERGDHLTVENIAFEETPVEAPVKLPWYKRISPELLDGSRTLAVLLIAVFAIFGVIRPTVRRTLGPGVKETQQLLEEPQTVAQVEGHLLAQEIPEDLDEPFASRQVPTLTRKVVKAAQAEPENAARLLREWLNEEAR